MINHNKECSESYICQIFSQILDSQDVDGEFMVFVHELLADMEREGLIWKNKNNQYEVI